MPPKETSESPKSDETRFAEKNDERMKTNQGYGAGVKNKTNPSPSTVPSSSQTDRAKPIRQN